MNHFVSIVTASISVFRGYLWKSEENRLNIFVGGIVDGKDGAVGEEGNVIVG